MFTTHDRLARRNNVDLASVRDTLLYIESDVARIPELQKLAGALRGALTEIAVIEKGKPLQALPATSAHFFPIDM